MPPNRFRQKIATKLVQPYAHIPLKLSLEHTTDFSSGEQTLSSKAIRLIANYKKEMEREQFGLHLKKSIPSKSHWKKLREESQSLLGEAPKGILTNERGDLYLYKEPKQKDYVNHGFKETFTELIISQLSAQITTAAEVSLGIYKGKIVLLSKIFLRKNKEELIHGTVLFSQLYDEQGIEEIQKNRAKQRQFYSLGHIFEAIKSFTANRHRPAEEQESILDDFSMMILTDCFTGNQDRHAENWGLVRDIEVNSFRFSPLFDNARGLFWNTSILQLAQKAQIDIQKFTLDYMNNSKPMISLENNENCTHFDLLIELTNSRPAIVKKFLSRLQALDIKSFMTRFRPMMSPLRYSIIVELLMKRRKRIHELVQQTLSKAK